MVRASRRAPRAIPPSVAWNKPVRNPAPFLARESLQRRNHKINSVLMMLIIRNDYDVVFRLAREMRAGVRRNGSSTRDAVEERPGGSSRRRGDSSEAYR